MRRDHAERLVALPWVMALCLLALVGLAQAPAGAEKIPAGPEARTRDDARQQQLSFARRTMVESYQRVGTRSTAWDEAALKCLETGARYFAGFDDVTGEDLVAQGRAALDAGCTDPMVLFWYAAGLDNTGRVIEAEEPMRRALSSMVERGYPRVTAAKVAGHLAQLVGETKGEQTADFREFRSLSVRYFADALTDGSCQEGEQDLFAGLIWVDWYPLYRDVSRELYNALRVAPNADPYVVKFVGGRHHIEEAWRARGTGWASEVTEEGWRGFEANLEVARRLLTQAWELHPEFPHAPTQMITVTMGGGGEPDQTERLWFDRAVRAQVDFPQAYRSLVWALRPRWGGSHEEMYSFGLECLGTGRFDTDVPMYFAYALQQITEDLDGERRYWRMPETREHLETLFEGYAKAGRPEKERTWYESVHAACDLLCGEYDEAAQRLEKLGDKLDEQAFEYYAGSLEAAKAEIAVQAIHGSGSERRVLFAFDVLTPEEKRFIHEDYKTVGIFDNEFRAAEMDARVVYAFTIPAEAESVALTVRAVNQFVIDVAPDVNGTPGEFEEEVNSVSLCGRKVYDMRNDREYSVDLTPYLKDNSARKVYVRIQDADPRDGWGAYVGRVEVAVLDDAERTRLGARQQELAKWAEEYRGRYLVTFAADGGEGEAPFLHDPDGSQTEGAIRKVEGDSYVVYRIPLTAEAINHLIVPYVRGDYSVSVARPRGDGPGEFSEVARARDPESGELTVEEGRVLEVPFGVTREMVEDGMCYVKLSDGAPDTPPGVAIWDLSVRQP